jgi:hypothetical protein
MTSPKKSDKQIQQHRRMQNQPQKQAAFLFINNELTEKEIRKTIPFTIASKNKIKYLGINLTKE